MRIESIQTGEVQACYLNDDFFKYPQMVRAINAVTQDVKNLYVVKEAVKHPKFFIERVKKVSDEPNNFVRGMRQFLYGIQSAFYHVMVFFQKFGHNVKLAFSENYRTNFRWAAKQIDIFCQEAQQRQAASKAAVPAPRTHSVVRERLDAIVEEKQQRDQKIAEKHAVIEQLQKAIDAMQEQKQADVKMERELLKELQDLNQQKKAAEDKAEVVKENYPAAPDSPYSDLSLEDMQKRLKEYEAKLGAENFILKQHEEAVINSQKTYWGYFKSYLPGEDVELKKIKLQINSLEGKKACLELDIFYKEKAAEFADQLAEAEAPLANLNEKIKETESKIRATQKAKAQHDESLESMKKMLFQERRALFEPAPPPA